VPIAHNGHYDNQPNRMAQSLPWGRDQGGGDSQVASL